MNCKVAFSGTQACPGFVDGICQIFSSNIAKDEESGWVGVSGEMVFWVFGRKDVNGGMFESVVAASFKNKR